MFISHSLHAAPNPDPRPPGEVERAAPRPALRPAAQRPPPVEQQLEGEWLKARADHRHEQSAFQGGNTTSPGLRHAVSVYLSHAQADQGASGQAVYIDDYA
ncbi:MAG TPA: hypothetical protein ENJ19_06180 [Gammaproteobacteria bacterium]|nr:hypothetical protein [Gammaproteobacteria bacterium]